jgi:hypothetical protein
LARKRPLEIYQRVFFDPLLLIGLIFLSLTYIMRGSWGGTFTEAATFVISIVWSYRAATTNPHVTFRLLATLVLILTSILLAIYLGRTNGLI